VNIARRLAYAALTVLGISLIYWTVLTVAQYRMQPTVLAALVLLALVIEFCWALARWRGPLHGVFGEPEQELAAVHVVQRELSRALRYDEPLTVVALHGSWRMTPRQMRSIFRASDILLRGHTGYVIALMPQTPIETGQAVIERLAQTFPLHAATLTDAAAVYEVMGNRRFHSRYNDNDQEDTREPAILVLRGLQVGIFRSKARKRAGQAAPVTVMTARSLQDMLNKTIETRVDEFTREIA
jgi:hypothetical protein